MTEFPLVSILTPSSEGAKAYDCQHLQDSAYTVPKVSHVEQGLSDTDLRGHIPGISSQSSTATFDGMRMLFPGSQYASSRYGDTFDAQT
jgi:hypothetical protein